jgi:transposase
MSLHPQAIGAVPEETARIARLALSEANLCVRLREVIGPLYEDILFVSLFPHRGRPAEAPWRLALVCVLQYVEGLSDRQAAEAVRTRLDWKFLLGLELSDPGFDYSILSEFRARLVEGQAIHLLLDRLLECCKQRGWVKDQGRQRTDSTHILSSARAQSRLEVIGETLRHALNVLAEAAPSWLRDQITPDWFDRYSRRVEEYRLPKGEEARRRYAEDRGADGLHLLQAVKSAAAPEGSRDLPAIHLLRQVWEQQFLLRDGRDAACAPPRNSVERGCAWTVPMIQRRTLATSAVSLGPGTRCI